MSHFTTDYGSVLGVLLKKLGLVINCGLASPRALLRWKWTRIRRQRRIYAGSPCWEVSHGWGFICFGGRLATIFTLKPGTLGFAVSHSAAVDTLGVWAVVTDVAVIVATKAFGLRAISPSVTLFHQAAVSAGFWLRPNNHFENRRRVV